MFTGQTVVLTGVGREGQLGEVVAAEFAARRARLILIDHRRETVDARVAAVGKDAVGYACDLTDAVAVEQLVRDVRAKEGGRLRALVHMVGGFAMSGPVADSSLDVWDSQISINLRSAYLTSRAFLPLLRTQGGSIVLFSSSAALPGATGAEMSAYAVAKTGVAVLARVIAAEERRHGVRANAVAPSSIRTAANLKAMGTETRYVEREQVAAAVAFLCSDAASAITGQLIALG